MVFKFAGKYSHTKLHQWQKASPKYTACNTFSNFSVDVPSFPLSQLRDKFMKVLVYRIVMKLNFHLHNIIIWFIKFSNIYLQNAWILNIKWHTIYFFSKGSASYIILNGCCTWEIFKMLSKNSLNKQIKTVNIKKSEEYLVQNFCNF